MPYCVNDGCRRNRHEVPSAVCPLCGWATHLRCPDLDREAATLPPPVHSSRYMRACPNLACSKVNEPQSMLQIVCGACGHDLELRSL